MSARDGIGKASESGRPPKADERLSDLYRNYAGWLERLLRKRFGPHDVDDLVQETYLRIVPYQTGTLVLHPKALLMRVATNLAYDRARRLRVRTGTGLMSVEQAGAAAQLTAQADQAEVLLLKQLILSMPTGQREVFVLSRFAGLSYDEIAQHLGIAVKTVEWRMSKALAHCAAHLRR